MNILCWPCFRPFSSSVPWSRFPVYRHWGVEVDTAAIVARFANLEPALLEHVGGKRNRHQHNDTDDRVGRIRPDDLPGMTWAGPDDWPRFLLVNQIAQQLVGARDDRLNYRCGQTATLNNNEEVMPTTYQLMRPNGEVQSVRSSENSLLVPWTEIPGPFRLKGLRGNAVSRGFSG